MKIVYYCPPFWGDGGPAAHAQGLVRGLRLLGHEVLVLPPRSAGVLGVAYRPPHRLVPQSVNAVARFLRAYLRAQRGGLARQCVQTLSEFAPDLLIVRRPPYDLVADAVVRAACCPVIGEVNAVAFWEAETYFGRRHDRFERHRQLAFYARCERLACVTEEVKAQLVALGFAAHKAVVVPNGVDTELFHPAVARAEGVFRCAADAERLVSRGVSVLPVAGAPRAERTPPAEPASQEGRALRPLVAWQQEPGRQAVAARALGEPAPALVVGYCASVTPLHDLPLAVAAFQKLQEDFGEQLAFLVVGPRSEDLVEAGASASLLERCAATGRVPHGEVPGLMAWMDVGCVALRGIHQSPLKVMEFMAMGIPVAAAADGSGLAPLVAAGAGLVTRAGDAGALAQSLRLLLTDPAKRATMGEAGRAWVNSYGTWKAVAARVLGENEC